MESLEDQKGISFTEAIERRYVDMTSVPKEALKLPQNEGNDRTIELVGFERVSEIQRSFEGLIEVNVSNMNISYCHNDCHQLIKPLSHTKSLILSNNLLESWTEVAKIISIIPLLNDLVLSYNKLKLPVVQEIDFHSFKTIKTLVLNHIDYDWNDILYCAQMWPNVQRLDLWDNRITDLKIPEPPLFDCLQYLSLCENSICSWNQICKLGFLPKLKTLNVANCSLTQIIFEDSDFTHKTKLFKQLECLIINNNKLSKWRDVAELNKLEKLENLIIKNNPVFNNEKYDTNFILILARIEKLKVLNREVITEFMRRDAELCYLRMFYKDFASINDENNLSKQEFMSENPTFEIILSKYGSPVGSNVESKAELDKKKFLTLKIRGPFDDKKTIEKKIPATISIVNLKAIIRRLFNIDFNYDINLLWTSQDFECPLDKEMQSLNFYSVENGDTIIVNVQ